MRIIMIFCLLIFADTLCIAQASIFSNDSVKFTSIVYQTVDDWSKTDTLHSIRLIYIDKKGHIIWIERPYETLKDDPALAEKMIKKNKIKSLFKVVKKGKQFSYVKISKPNEIIFQSPKGLKDTIRKMTFFAESGHREVYKLYYAGDSILQIKGRNIPCYFYKSISYTFNEISDGSSWTSYFLFEKRTCMPIFIFTNKYVFKYTYENGKEVLNKYFVESDYMFPE